MSNIRVFFALILTAGISISCGPSAEEVAETKMAQTAEFEVKLAAAIEQTIAAKPTKTNTPEPLATPTPVRCDQTEYLATVEAATEIFSRFASTREIAGGTGRGALTPVMLQLDQIYWEMKDLAVPECLEPYKAYTVSYMESSIEAYKDFQVDGTQTDDWFAQGTLALKIAAETLEMAEAESLSGVPPDIMDLPGVPLSTDTLKFLQSGYEALLKGEVKGDIATTVTVETWNSAHHNGHVEVKIRLPNFAYYGTDKMQEEVLCPLVLKVHETMASSGKIDQSYAVSAKIYGPNDISAGTMCLVMAIE